jgi:hypothetical protein
MQDRPDQETLLDAVAQFLLEEVHPALEKEKRLAFRVLIAANLANVVANELRAEGGSAEEELSRLRALLPEVDVAGLARAEARRKLNRELASRLRDGRLPAGARVYAHVRATLLADLATANPRFDTAAEIEPRS